eukprot:416371_1
MASRYYPINSISITQDIIYTMRPWFHCNQFNVLLYLLQYNIILKILNLSLPVDPVVTKESQMDLMYNRKNYMGLGHFLFVYYYYIIFASYTLPDKDIPHLIKCPLSILWHHFNTYSVFHIQIFIQIYPDFFVILCRLLFLGYSRKNIAVFINVHIFLGGMVFHVVLGYLYWSHAHFSEVNGI